MNTQVSETVEQNKCNTIPDAVVLEKYPALKVSLEKRKGDGWDDSDGYTDKDSWGDSGWGEHVD